MAAQHYGTCGLQTILAKRHFWQHELGGTTNQMARAIRDLQNDVVTLTEA